MDAVRVREYGGPDVLEAVDLPLPEPGPGQVRVALAATGVNFVEVYQREGRNRLPLPFVPGTEGAGTVTARGPGVDTVRVGDRVASVDLAGAYAAEALVAADRVVPVPDAMDMPTAAAVLLQGLTAHYLMRDTYPVGRGDAVLVHAAAGGMGLLLTQLATHLGATVIGTVSTPDKERLAREAGAAEVIHYGERDVAHEVRRLTGGAGVAAVYDGVGRDTFDGSLESLHPRGTLVLYGAASGPVPPFDPQRLERAGSLFLTRPSLRHHIGEAAELHRRAADVFAWVTEGVLAVRVHERYPLPDARRAHADLQARRTTGKLLLVP